jgi:hypothetical protein
MKSITAFTGASTACKFSLMSRAGVRPGDKVCLIYPTCAEFFYTFFGALRIGAVPVPLYPTLGVEATAGIFRDSHAVAVAIHVGGEIRPFFPAVEFGAIVEGDGDILRRTVHRQSGRGGSGLRPGDGADHAGAAR